MIFLLFSYFAPALVCTAIALSLYYFLRNTRHAKSILAALLVVSWAPIDVYAWHSVGITQLLYALLFNQENWLGPTSPWSYLVSLTGTVILAHFAACRIHLKSKKTFQGSKG
jgi:hypothetical protein